MFYGVLKLLKKKHAKQMFEMISKDGENILYTSIDGERFSLDFNRVIDSFNEEDKHIHLALEFILDMNNWERIVETREDYRGYMGD